ncbi:MAG: hypothetical protein IPO17_12635 [Flavobacteriales bacterium]|nr:hypothetical protein [Flavobacteriales bacterium]
MQQRFSQSLMAFLGGFPANGGTWSGPSPVVGFTYDPVTMVPGVYTYTVTGNPPCANATATVTVTETPAPAVTTGTYGPLCSNGAAITLAGTPVGGTWTGTGVTGNSFDPAAGTQTLTYTVTAGGCTNSAVTTIAVNPAPVAGANTALALCTTSGMTSLYPLLVGAQPGGIWYKVHYTRMDGVQRNGRPILLHRRWNVHLSVHRERQCALHE